MTAASLLARMQEIGAALRVEDGRLIINAPKGAITPALKDHLTRLKPALIDLLRRSRQQDSPDTSPICSQPLEGELPLSYAQQRMWLLQQIDGAGAYNIPAAIRISGPLDIPSLRRCFDQIVQRHAALRTVIEARQGQPIGRLAQASPITLPVTDLSDTPGDRQQQVEDLRRQEALGPFDLSKGPLLRGRILRLAQDEHVLLITLHHLVCDGWSLGVLLGELAEAYDSSIGGRQPCWADLPIQYPDYARWQRQWLSGDRLDRQIEYWRKVLHGELPTLELPADRARPAVQTFHGAVHRVELPADLVASLQQTGQAHGCTLFMVLLAGFAALLARYCRQQDIVIGTPIAGRTRPELEGLIGLFVNTLALRLDLSDEPTFRGLLVRARQASMDAYVHQDTPFEKIVEVLQPRRDMSRSPLFQTMLILQNAPLPRMRLGRASLVPLPDCGHVAKFDLTLEVIQQAGQTIAGWNYNRDLLDEAMVGRMARHFEVLVRSAVAQPDQPISQLAMMSPADRAALIYNLNDTSQPYERGVCLHELIERSADAHGSREALVFEDTSLSYSELESRANRLVNRLRRRGIGPESLVGVSLQRSVDLVVALLGVLKAGAAYVPLDPSYPADRLQYMVADSQVRWVIAAAGDSWLDTIDGVRRVTVNEIMREESDDSRPASGVCSHNVAYMIYTSGSTGQPKGAMNEHAGIVNRLQWMQQQYALGADDRVLQKTPFGFDVSVWEFFWPLMTGATLVVAKPEGHRDAKYLAQLIDEQQISTIHFVPSMLEVFLEEIDAGACKTLRRVICSGEALSWDLKERFYAKLGCQLHNLYGPTEAAVDVTYWPCDRQTGAKVVPIGYPVANTRVHILDERMEPVPQGVRGEIYLGGVQVGRGYWRRPGLTAERFLPDPFCTKGGSRLYRTGDAGRYREDGSIEYLGRLDDQVKIRGFRIELGEIESRLREIAGVKEAAVAVKGEGPAKRLIGYVTRRGDDDLDIAQLRQQLRQHLPEYMVPATIVQLDQLPLSPNGKLDRKALPEPKAADMRHQGNARTLPRTPTEQRLAAIWADVLPVKDIAVEDDFFELGGHSLLAAQVVARLRDTFDIELPLRGLFESPTLEGLASLVDRKRADHAHSAQPAITVTDRVGALPLSFGQQRLWFLEQLEPGVALYNVPLGVRLSGPLDVNALERAINEVVRRHEILRTVFGPGDGEGVQCVLDSLIIRLPVQDISELPGDEQAAEVRRRSEQEAILPFDLVRGPLLRGRLLRLAPQEHVLLLTMHHIVCDGWSTGVLMRETGQLYDAFLHDGPASLQPLPIQFADYALWQRSWLTGDTLARQVGYWRDRLGSNPPVLTLPTDRPRPTEQTYAGATVSFAIQPGTMAALEHLGRSEGATLFMTLLTGLAVLLSRCSNQDDLVIGTPVAGRRNAQTEGLIGFFVNTLPLRISLGGEPSFRNVLREVREAALAAYAHQDVPFEKLVDELHVRRDPSRTPLFQVVFAMQNTPLPALRLGEMRMTPLPEPGNVAKFDLMLTIQPAPDGEGLAASLNYNRDLFDADTVQRMAERFGQLLEAAVAETDTTVSRLPLLTVQERRVLADWSGTQSDYPRDRCVHELFEEQAALHGDSVAIVANGHTLTYRQLNEQANAWACRLMEQGIGLETPVGLCVDRSPEMIVGMLAILKAGGAYVPLDAALPEERLRLLVHDTRTRVVFVHKRFAERLTGLCSHILYLDDTLPGLADNPRRGATAEHLAYVMYTSGSTGRPKGVAVVHRGIVRLVRNTNYAKFDAEQVFLQLAPFSFDASTLEIWGPLLNGGRLVIPPSGMPSLADLSAMIRRHGVTTLWLTAGLFHQIVSEDIALLDPVQQVLAGGDVLSVPHVRRVLERRDGGGLINGYGPTESTTFACCCRLETPHDLRQTVPIGRPIANTSVYILDRHLQPVPMGVAGEVYIGGDGLARGYVNQPGLTAEAFIPNPFARRDGERLYRTGDLARWLSDGRIEFLGRGDLQVKIRGYRIEPGEVEAGAGTSSRCARGCCRGPR